MKRQKLKKGQRKKACSDSENENNMDDETDDTWEKDGMGGLFDNLNVKEKPKNAFEELEQLKEQRKNNNNVYSSNNTLLRRKRGFETPKKWNFGGNVDYILNKRNPKYNNNINNVKNSNNNKQTSVRKNLLKQFSGSFHSSFSRL